MLEQTLPGAKWRNTHQATVNSVLGGDPKSPKYRRVESTGSTFFNTDSWYARTFGLALTQWSRLNKEAIPTSADVENWIYNSTYRARYVPEKKITIAATPDDLDKSLAMALVGGAYHEAWHTEYSRREPLLLEEVWDRIKALWPRIPYAPEKGYRGWARLTDALLTWSNIIEDIRIERIGCREFPGAPPKMEALQDLILDMEAKGRVAAEDKSLSNAEDLSVVMGAFRDLGLGYQTTKQRLALDSYKVRSPEGWALVNEGALRPLLDRAIALDKKDSLESLWLAMEILIVLSDKIAAEILKKDLEKKLAAEKAKGEAQKAPPPPAPKGNEEARDATGEDNELPEEGSGASSSNNEKPPIYKVGDRVKILQGAYAGKEAQVVWASLPDPTTGVQALKYALVLSEE
jgi:hypothetical protein